MRTLNIPFYYYKKNFQNNSDPKWIRIVFQPKRVLYRLFGFAFKNYIFNNKRFNKLKNTFKITFKNVELEKSIPEELDYNLKYPSGLRNFTCESYYKPFLKPMIHYFDNKYFIKAHSYAKNNVVQKDLTESDKFCNINYEKLRIVVKDNKKIKISETKDAKTKIRCENITNKGSIFGCIYLSISLMVFEDKSEKDERTSEDLSFKDKLFFLFSSDVSDRIQDNNKYIIIYYSEIKEIIPKKYIFHDLAHEIFMKDGRSYFFNFFTTKNRGEFFENLSAKINIINTELIEEEKKKTKTNFYYLYDKDYVELSVKDKLFFENSDFKLKYTKGEISNFQYLLLINKFSSRTYNDNSQYLIFPLLYMDTKKTRERDLSKPICLNKDLTEEDLDKFRSNYESMGHHFNIHYSTYAYTLFYLMRLLPFTYGQIKLQSGIFDDPARMFTSLENLLFVFENSDENRELCPEFFHSFESFINLNYNNFGYNKMNKIQIHNLNTNQNIGIYEFVIDLRNLLEEKELSPWINNIFGVNQLCEDSEILNKFPDYSYEQQNNFKHEKEIIVSEVGEDENAIDASTRRRLNDKINDIKSRIQLLTLGLTPSQLFKSAHPKRECFGKFLDSTFSKDKRAAILRRRGAKYSINKNLIDFLSKFSLKYVQFIFSINENENVKIVLIFEKEMEIFNLLSEDRREKEMKNIKIFLDPTIPIVKFKPYKNILIELFNNIFLMSRLTNRTMLLCSETHQTYIEWPCIVTAVELYSHQLINTNSLNEIHLSKVIIGDEEGNICLIKIEIAITLKTKELTINDLSVLMKKQRVHYSYINEILYHPGLNAIFTSSSEGIITINNGFSFELINIIEINNNPNILEFKISEFDLLYIYTHENINNSKKYTLYCYSLNGVKVSELHSSIDFLHYYYNNSMIHIIYKDGTIHKYNCVNLKNEIKSDSDKNEIKYLMNAKDIYFCSECFLLKNIFLIYNKESKNLRSII